VLGASAPLTFVDDLPYRDVAIGPDHGACPRPSTAARNKARWSRTRRARRPDPLCARIHVHIHSRVSVERYCRARPRPSHDRRNRWDPND